MEEKNEHCLQISRCQEVPDGAKLIAFEKFPFEIFLQQAFKKDLEGLERRSPL